MTHLPVFQNLEVTKLDLGENNVRIITPQSLFGLRNLDELVLSQNQLDDESFSQNCLLNLTFLRKLDLDDNQITRIPALPASLEELKINKNQLTVLTDHCFQGVKNLLKLELKLNTLYEASVSPATFRPLQKLLELQLDNNRFRSLPLGLPSSLQVLKMNGNLLEEVAVEALRDCIHLKVLNLSHNFIHDQSIDSNSWTRLRSLEDLDLSHNRLTSIPVNLPRFLRKLILQHNSIRHIPAFTFRHMRAGLQSLHLSHNELSTEGAERHSFVGTYRSMRELLLDNNRLQDIPRCVRQFKNLQVLRLENNQIRQVRQWAVCHPGNSGSTLVSVHLEYNLLEEEAIAPKAFSCVTDTQGLVLHPQQGKRT
ncbi:extracellular matrix protein 2 [Gambusia affinis]|uniref:extracellular matrix protein 2 n=1 Tax=Gambusia affinis TaxID=33528 RepID=UPI001CDBAE3C|nr:extracellular matrix protein 2 [Gambusia affinis]